MRLSARLVALAVMLCLGVEVWAANSVVVESKQVAPGATGVTVGTYVTNDVSLTGLLLILEVREITPGSFTTNTFALTIQSRVAASGLMDFPTMRYFGSPDVMNTCSGPVSNTYSTPSGVDFISPDAFEWAGVQTVGPLLVPGTDGSPGVGTPSFLLSFDVTGVEGWFEIDTCCTTPNNHINFIDASYVPLLPSFQKGTVTIGDPQPNSPPVAICVSLLTGTDAGTCERASVDPAEVDGGSYDPDDDPITLRVNPLGPYALGVNDVWLVVEDDSHDMDSCQTTITVEDNEPPVVTCPSTVLAYTDPGQCDAVVSFSAPVVTDNCAVDAVTIDPPSGSVFPVLDITTVTVVATDLSGNADTCYFDVIVEDGEPPSAICPNDTTVEVAYGESGAYVTFVYDADDNCPGVVAGATPPSGSFFPIGTTTVEVVASDGAGNFGYCWFDVAVVELVAGNLVEVESKTVTAGDGGVEIGVYITNDISLGGLYLPLEFRALTPGCFLYGSLAITPQGRVGASGLTDLMNDLYYPTPEISNGCSGPVSNTYVTTGSLDFTSPDAAYWMGLRVFGSYLDPGTDGAPGSGTPSFLLTFNVAWEAGTFEIDTCCVAPDVHLEFFDRMTGSYAPDFTKGVITVVPSSGCSDHPGDVDCNGVIDVIDVVTVVNSAFRGAPNPSRCCPSGP